MLWQLDFPFVWDNRGREGVQTSCSIIDLLMDKSRHRTRKILALQARFETKYNNLFLQNTTVMILSTINILKNVSLLIFYADRFRLRCLTKRLFWFCTETHSQALVIVGQRNRQKQCNVHLSCFMWLMLCYKLLLKMLVTFGKNTENKGFLLKFQLQSSLWLIE